MANLSNKETTEKQSSSRIWYQSFVDPKEQHPYTKRLQNYLNSHADPKYKFVLHGISPPDRYLSPLSEFRCAGRSIRNAIEAEESGYDAFVIGHFQEPGLVESRAAVDIPVVGLGEATMFYSCLLGRTFGLVTINPVFIPWHRDQVKQLGLEQRTVGIRAVNTEVATYMQAFEKDKYYRKVKDEFIKESLKLVEGGAEVIIPAGGLPMLLFTREKNFTIEGAVVLNGIAVVLSMMEMTLKLYRQTGVHVSRKGTFSKAKPEALSEFLSSP